MGEGEAVAGAEREFERQVENLLERGYPRLAGLREDEFLRLVMPAAGALGKLAANGAGSGSQGRAGFALVVRATLVQPVEAVGVVDLHGKSGFTSMEPDDLGRFAPVPDLDVPEGPAYLVGGLDTGRDLLNVTPDDALPRIAAEGRSPLTIDEGIGLVTQFPEILEAENSFSLLGSRCGDRRVTAIWLSERRPRLGWCWAGNPHTWLGSASCAVRVGA
jgi:hypothetical protein